MLEPIRDFLVVSVPKQDEKVGGGFLYRPATAADEKMVTGTVLAVGSGHLTSAGATVPLTVKAGNTVLFNKQMAVEVKHNDEVVFVIREENVLSIVR